VRLPKYYDMIAFVQSKPELSDLLSEGLPVGKTINFRNVNVRSYLTRPGRLEVDHQGYDGNFELFRLPENHVKPANGHEILKIAKGAEIAGVFRSKDGNFTIDLHSDTVVDPLGVPENCDYFLLTVPTEFDGLYHKIEIHYRDDTRVYVTERPS